MSGEESFFVEDEGIDPERIVNDEHLVANEFLCEICGNLLWKPRSCSSCQHLFCNKCIRTWLKINPTSCPFRCSPYEEKRAPPYIQSLLGRLSIRCRNHSFGCTEILSYNSLEQHQTIECQFPTKQCRVCEKYILISEINQHQQSCISPNTQCFLCKCLVDRASFQQHLIECFQEKLNLLLEHITPTPDATEIPVNNPFIFPQDQGNDNWFGQLNNQVQRFLFAMPKINLAGIQEVIQARQQSKWTRITTMFRLMSLNLSVVPQILLILLFFGIGIIAGFLFCLSLEIQTQVEKSIYRSFALIILFSGLICFGLPILLTSINDTSIIISIVFTLILGVSMCPELPIDYLQIYYSKTILPILYLIAFLLFKLSLLMIRSYFWYIPPYISAGCLAWITIFITFHIRRLPIRRE